MSFELVIQVIMIGPFDHIFHPFGGEFDENFYIKSQLE